MLKLASSLGFALAVADLKRRIQHWVRSGIFAAAGAIVALVALAFLLVALHLWLSSLVGPIGSALIIGGVFAVVAIILFYIASRPMDARSPVAAASDASAAGQMADALRDGAARLSAAAGGSGSPLRSPVFLASAAALAAGIVFGRSSKKRRERDAED